MNGWQRRWVMSRLRWVVFFVGTTLLFIPADFRRAAPLHVTWRRHAVGRSDPARSLLVQTTAFLVGDLLGRARLGLPVPGTLHGRRGTLFAFTGCSLGSSDGGSWRRSSPSDARATRPLHCHIRAVVELLVRIRRTRRGRTLFTDRANLRRRGEWPVMVRRHRACRRRRSTARRRRGSTGSWSRRQRSASGRVEGTGTGTAGGTLMRRWRRRVPKLGQGVVGVRSSSHLGRTHGRLGTD